MVTVKLVEVVADVLQEAHRVLELQTKALLAVQMVEAVMVVLVVAVLALMEPGLQLTELLIQVAVEVGVVTVMAATEALA
jgi:hypothetical protein